MIFHDFGLLTRIGLWGGDDPEALLSNIICMGWAPHVGGPVELRRIGALRFLT